MCGTETITRQQKNTSFGANTFRDGVSYSEQQQKNPLIEIDDLANLSVGECYTLFAEPAVRLAKIQTPEAQVKDKHIGFIQKQEMNNHFEDSSLVTSQAIQEQSVAGNSETENSTISEIKSVSSFVPSTKAKKKIKRLEKKLTTKTINNEKSNKIFNNFIPKL